MTKQLLFKLVILWCCSPAAYGCTIFTMTRGGVTLIGNNEYWHKTDSYIKFIPASDNSYGRMFFGFGKNCRYTFGGINDQGLFYDIASLTERNDVEFDPGKETVENPVYERMLEECSDIGEAIALIRKYNVNGFKRHHIMIVDRTGNSAIVEWGTDSLSAITNQSGYQVMTNYNNTDPEFLNPRAIAIDPSVVSPDNGRILGVMSLYLLPFLILLFNIRKEKLVLCLFALFSLPLAQCSGITVRETAQQSYTLTNLENNTTYYWKIQAIQKPGMMSSSNLYNFITGD